jgi:hypothetical protein
MDVECSDEELIRKISTLDESVLARHRRDLEEGGLTNLRTPEKARLRPAQPVQSLPMSDLPSGRQKKRISPFIVVASQLTRWLCHIAVSGANSNSSSYADLNRSYRTRLILRWPSFLPEGM